MREPKENTTPFMMASASGAISGSVAAACSGAAMHATGSAAPSMGVSTSEAPIMRVSSADETLMIGASEVETPMLGAAEPVACIAAPEQAAATEPEMAPEAEAIINGVVFSFGSRTGAGSVTFSF